MSIWPSIIALNAAGIAATAVGGYVSVAPTCGFWGPVQFRAPDNQIEISLTFDDGPHPTATPAILDLLGELETPATFFVIGQYAQRHPQLIERIHREGHLLGNHSWDHSRWIFHRGTNYFESQLARTESTIESIVGERPALYRPPFGIRTCFSMHAARRQETSVITWSWRARDGVETTTDSILARVASARGGDVMLLHDGVEPGMRRDPSATVAAVKPLILQLRERGLRPAPLDKLLRIPALKEADAAAATASAPA